MKIRLLKIGRIKKEFQPLLTVYHNRLKSFSKIEFLELKNNDQTLKYLTDLKQKTGQIIVCLDEKGKQWSSTELSSFIARQKDSPMTKSLVFVVGSPYGLPSEISTTADYHWSLSNATFPSDLAWLLLHEQVYRAFNIISGTPYHHE
ncbi:MAG: 23S rRNA (pseudouridine(1915)-N(3))-methyltransferase RlmH [Oligoflexales bacterium]|nr:23S rRNA (pseudouridine(1915)-N(3))-methyltransferase RlmH [Oligoflexales bacterium]